MSELSSYLDAYLADQKFSPKTNRVEPVRDDYGEKVVEACTKKYRYCRYISAGGEAVLFLVRDINLKCHRVLKIALPTLKEKPRHRFERSMEGLAKLSSDYFSVVIELSRDPLFAVLSWFEGEDMRIYAGSPRYAKVKSLNLFFDLLSAARILHDAEIVHRDIKPENVVINRDRVKLIDFGLAKTSHDQNITTHDCPLGTVNYASPEQIKDACSADVRADICSLGYLYYFLVTRQESRDPRFLEDNEADFFSIATNDDKAERFQSVAEMQAEFLKVYPALFSQSATREIKKEYTELDAIEDLLVAFKGNCARVQLYSGMSSIMLDQKLTELRERRAL